jgi:hypothetical protein
MGVSSSRERGEEVEQESKELHESLVSGDARTGRVHDSPGSDALAALVRLACEVEEEEKVRTSELGERTVPSRRRSECIYCACLGDLSGTLSELSNVSRPVA